MNKSDRFTAPNLVPMDEERGTTQDVGQSLNDELANKTPHPSMSEHPGRDAQGASSDHNAGVSATGGTAGEYLRNDMNDPDRQDTSSASEAAQEGSGYGLSAEGGSEE